MTHTTRADTARVRRRASHPRRAAVTLAFYSDASGAEREVVSRPAARDTVLVIDRDHQTRCDERLVAHLGADEPARNAALVCELYVAEATTADARPPRPLRDGDLTDVPYPTAVRTRRCDFPTSPQAPSANREQRRDGLTDELGFTHRIELVGAAGTCIPELRWLRHPPAGQAGPPLVVTLRDVIGAMESYEPARELSQRAIAAHRRGLRTSTFALSHELARMAASHVVLNRGLREAVLAVSARKGLSMSQIAVRCGRVKRDVRGNVSGETSWLARRLGLLAERGDQRPTPWIHSHVLALIVREGLGMAPHEVELG